MLDRAKLVNIVLFLERLPALHGLENHTDAMAYAETYQAVVAQIKALDEPEKVK